MLIESAFLKLPELMLSSYTHGGNVEAMVVNYLATGLQMELNSRSVPFAYNHITVEKPYPNQSRTGSVFRADLFFDSRGSLPGLARLTQYGFKEMQWLEAKSFFSKGSSSPTTQNVGRIIKDLIRLCILPEELPGYIRQNGRYALMVFDQHPSKYLAYKDRSWLEQIFEERTPSIHIDLTSEQKSLIRSVVGRDMINAKLDLKLSVLHFEPSAFIPKPVYWGYLLRIDEFSISINDSVIESRCESNDYWNKEKIAELASVKSEFVSLLKRDEGAT
ncbi:hypothetical protein WH43_04540 [Rheinheimera sp. KL1]|uniref:hypothetical protein n=1 Tax=Rheinheimera sp. KL1 TaxID=1635005 RepID=UPI0006A95CFB|nr:hypothetical protein [Rheinheimera sp. KL1]KOO59248.1 hypothetical protein WH43_04540 [Rheinheimera sp. KL1]